MQLVRFWPKAEDLNLNGQLPHLTPSGHHSLAEEELNSSMAFGTFREWIPVQALDSELE